MKRSRHYKDSSSFQRPPDHRARGTLILSFEQFHSPGSSEPNYMCHSEFGADQTKKAVNTTVSKSEKVYTNVCFNSDNASNTGRLKLFSGVAIAVTTAIITHKIIV